MLQIAEQRGNIEGIKICRRATRVNHLIFADDSLILMKARVNDAQELKDILDLYEQVAGQKRNREKSSLMFRPSTDQDIEAESNLIFLLILNQ